MDDETERELSIERKVNTINLYQFYRKPHLTRFFDNAELICQTLNVSSTEIAEFMRTIFLISGSSMEGASLARNLNPNLNKKYFEREVDMMLPVTRILRNRSREVIVDLKHAKGFAWIKHKPGCFDSKHELDSFWIKHKDYNTYLSSKAVRDSFIKRPGPSHYLFCHSEEMVEGPSANWKYFTDTKKFPSEDTVLEAMKKLQECISLIDNTSKPLQKFHSDVSSKLKELEKIIQGNSTLINMTDVEELASVVLPKKKERQNFLLKVHWMSIAFINETLSAIYIIGKTLPKKDLLERLGIARNFYFFDLWSLSLFKAKEIFKHLDSYFKYLVYFMTKEVYEKYKANPKDGLLHFLQKCLQSKEDEIKKLFQVFSDCKSHLLHTCYWLETLKGQLQAGMLVDYKTIGRCYNLDRVPAIAVVDFPNIAQEWVTRHRVWPSLSVVNRIVMLGCHIVPKPYDGEEGNIFLDWRWSFSLAETILANVRTTRMDISHLLLKSIFYRYLKPIEHDNKTLASYLVKTVMMWQCEEKDEAWWSNKSLVKCTSVLLNRLKVAFFNKHLPHYFIPEINLFRNVSDELVLYGQAILESICVDPVVCIEEVLEFYGFEDTMANNENTSETGLKPKLNIYSLMAQLPKTIEVVEEKHKDQTQQRDTGGAMNLFETAFKNLMPNLLPGVPTDNLSEENTSRDNEINFDDLIETINPEFSHIFDIPLD